MDLENSSCIEETANVFRQCRNFKVYLKIVIAVLDVGQMTLCLLTPRAAQYECI